MSKKEETRRAAEQALAILAEKPRDQFPSMPRPNLRALIDAARFAISAGYGGQPRMGRTTKTLGDGRYISFEMPFEMTEREIKFAKALFTLQITGCEKRTEDEAICAKDAHMPTTEVDSPHD